jgi:hypothetical protein
VKQIDVNDRHDVWYWAGVLDATSDQIKAAVAAVGPLVEDVRRFLEEQKARPAAPGRS